MQNTQSAILKQPIHSDLLRDRLGDSWYEGLKGEFEKEYFADLTHFVRTSYQTKVIFPKKEWIFRAFKLCPLENLKVCILGQDPYHTPDVADGLAFSTNDKNPIPPSLQNIYKEIAKEFGTPIPHSPDLTRWATQGVLLLNATLTVESGRAASHQGKGWEEFTQSVIQLVNAKTTNTVFMLWGASARKKATLIDKNSHLVLESPHPSPLSAHNGFFGNNHFRLCNDYLQSHNKTPIVW